MKMGNQYGKDEENEKAGIINSLYLEKRCEGISDGERADCRWHCRG